MEREARDLKLAREGRLALRHAKSVPILDNFKVYLGREQPKGLPKSPESAGPLQRNSEDGDLEIGRVEM